MPYIASKKTDGRSADREVIDAAVETAARKVAERIRGELSLIGEYKRFFVDVALLLRSRIRSGKAGPSKALKVCSSATGVSEAVYEQGRKYRSEGAFLGELNYAVTSFIQRVPAVMVESGRWKEEFRYWLYAATVEALILAQHATVEWGMGFGGVFEDVKDEYKREANPAYEAEQIVKSGHAFFTPYYNRLIEIVDENGQHIGYQEVMLKRSPETLHKDVLEGQFVIRAKPRP